MIPGDIYLNTTLLPSGSRTVTPTPVEEGITKRVASGKLVEEIIRRYTNYQIDYEYMTGDDHENLEALYNLNTNLSLIIMDRLGVETVTEVKMTWTPGTRELIFGDWLWSGVSITLEVV
jgi:histidinol phosphatase-like enzyme